MAKTRDQVRVEALEALRKYQRGGAAISMGVGKTRLGLDHFQLVMNKLIRDEDRNAKGLVVAPKKDILESWKKEAKKWGMDHLVPNLSFSTYRSLVKLKQEDYDVIYFDECQALNKTYAKWLNLFQGYIIGLTGTPPAHPFSEKGQMVRTYCPMRYEYLLSDAVNDNILNNYKIIVHLLPLGTSKNLKIETKDSKGRVTKTWWTSETVNYDYWCESLSEAESFLQIQKISIMRMKAMHKYRTKEEYAKRLLTQSANKCILFANTQDQADDLCKHSYHANNKDSEINMQKFETGEITKLSTVLQLAEGANIQGLKELIIMHAYGNNRSSSQRIGRGLRLNPDDECIAHILCFKDTIDEKWVIEALQDFDQDKIEWYDPDIF